MLDILKLPDPDAKFYTADQMIEYARRFSEHFSDEIIELREKIAKLEYDLYLFRLISQKGLNIELTAQDGDHWRQHHNDMLARLKESNQPKPVHKPDPWAFD